MSAIETSIDPDVQNVPNRQERRSAEKFRASPHRRRQFLSHVRADHSIVRAAIATLEALLEHSDDFAKPAWPSQVRLAQLTGQDQRTVQRHLAELRDAGYLKVFVSVPERDKETGRWRRRKTNRYYFCRVAHGNKGRRIRRNGRSHLDDSGALLNPLFQNPRRPVGAGGLVHRLKSSLIHVPTKQTHVWSDKKGCEQCGYTRYLIDEETNSASLCACSE